MSAAVAAAECDGGLMPPLHLHRWGPFFPGEKGSVSTATEEEEEDAEAAAEAAAEA